MEAVRFWKPVRKRLARSSRAVPTIQMFMINNLSIFLISVVLLLTVGTYILRLILVSMDRDYAEKLLREAIQADRHKAGRDNSRA